MCCNLLHFTAKNCGKLRSPRQQRSEGFETVSLSTCSINSQAHPENFSSTARVNTYGKKKQRDQQESFLRHRENFSVPLAAVRRKIFWNGKSQSKFSPINSKWKQIGTENGSQQLLVCSQLQSSFALSLKNICNIPTKQSIKAQHINDWRIKVEWRKVVKLDLKINQRITTGGDWVVGVVAGSVLKNLKFYCLTP